MDVGPPPSMVCVSNITDWALEKISSGYAAGTMRAYANTLSCFQNFAADNGLPSRLPLTFNVLLEFIRFLDKKYSNSTINSMVSAISFYHKINNLEDPTKNFVIIRLLKSVGFKATKVALLPLTKSLLSQVIEVFNDLLPYYDYYLMSAIFILGYQGAFRLGELVKSNDLKHTIMLENISFIQKGDSMHLVVKMMSFKHSVEPTSLVICEQANVLCSVRAVKNFLVLRGSTKGPLFLDCRGNPVTRDQVVSVLKTSIEKLGLDPNLFNGHSLRIGRTTDLAKDGFSALRIKQVGRWKSNAFHKYIRDSSVPPS